MDFEILFEPAEDLDAWLTGLLAGAPLVVALAVAFMLGLRHASDPDHLVAVTSLVAGDDGDVRAAARLGAWWGLGHAGTLLAVGLPLIALKGELPAWLKSGAETAVGIVIVLLAVRVIYRWRRPARTPRLRSRRQAVGIGLLHGLAGTGAVVVLLMRRCRVGWRPPRRSPSSRRCRWSRWRCARARSRGRSRGPRSRRSTARR